MSELQSVTANDLTFLQEEFCHEYVANGGNGTQAAKAAGYSGNPGTLAHVASTNVRLPHVQAYIDQLKQKARDDRDARLREKHLGRDQILYELAVLAGFDLGGFMTAGVLDMGKIKGEATKAIASIDTEYKMVNGERRLVKSKLKAHDKLAALRLLMQHLGMINEQQVTINVDFGERMAQRRMRAIEGELK